MVTSWEICGYVLYTVAGAGRTSGVADAVDLLGCAADWTGTGAASVKAFDDLVKSGALICG